MPPITNVLFCILVLLIGYLIGKAYRTNHKAKKNPRYTKDGKLDMSQYKNLTALHDHMEERREEKESHKRK